MRLREIHIQGFKSVVDQRLALGRVNCFIGANGVGKSNLLEAIGVLGAAAAGRVDDEAVLRRGVRAGLPRLFKTAFAAAPTPDLLARGMAGRSPGFSRLFVRSGIPPHITLEACGEPEAVFRVSLLNPLGNPGPAWSYKIEFLSSGATEIVSRGVRDRRKLERTSGLSALKVVELQPEDPASVLLKMLQNYAIYSPNTPALRGTVPDVQMRPPVGLAGGGLAEGFEALKRAVDEERIDEVLDLIDWASEVGATEAAGALLSPAVPRSKAVLKFTDRFMATARNTLTAYDASEGSLYVLFAALLCLSSDSPAVFAIDNLDSALNPRLVTRLVARIGGWLRSRNPDRQLLFTAHNPAVLDGLDLDQDDVRLFAVERNSAGHTTVRRVEVSPALKEQNGRYPLSRLWVMGNLGAVPNV